MIRKEEEKVYKNLDGSWNRGFEKTLELTVALALIWNYIYDQPHISEDMLLFAAIWRKPIQILIHIPRFKCKKANN